jgi:ubiquitin carboxyl-terminal hydrolase 4/11/15
VTADNSAQDSEEDADNDQQRSRSPAGNGSRLDDSSRNGSSSAGAVVAGVGALRGGGYQRSTAGNTAKNGAEAGETLSEGLPAYEEDEGYVGGDYNTTNPWEQEDQPVWSFSNLNHTNDSDDAASDAPALGSAAGDLGNRMLEDFGDDEVMGHGGSSPTNEEEVAEIRLVGDD